MALYAVKGSPMILLWLMIKPKDTRLQKTNNLIIATMLLHVTVAIFGSLKPSDYSLKMGTKVDTIYC